MRLQDNALWDTLLTIFHFLERPLVQGQLAAFLVAVLSAWLITSIIWRLLGRPLLKWAKRFEGRKGFFALRFTRLMHRLLFPLLGLVAIRFSSNYFRSLDTVSGLLDECITIFWIFTAYRLIVTTLYTVFPEKYVARFHHRILSPVFIVWASARLLNTIVSLPSFLATDLFTLFGLAITVQTFLLATLGFYLWIDSVSAIRDVWTQIVQKRNREGVGLTVAWLSIGSYILFFAGFIIVFNLIGLDPSALAFITGGLSVGVGFSLRSVLGNFLSGLILLFERSLKPGDVIEVDGLMATVDKLNIRATTVRTFSDVEIVIPNESLLTSNVTTYTGSSKRLRIDINVGISYDNDPEEARVLLLSLAKETELVLETPEPICLIMGFGDSSIDLSLKVWIAEIASMGKVRNALNTSIWRTFADEGIEIPYPQRDLRVRGEAESFIKSKTA